jgi:hypothetical protein
VRRLCHRLLLRHRLGHVNGEGGARAKAGWHDYLHLPAATSVKADPIATGAALRHGDGDPAAAAQAQAAAERRRPSALRARQTCTVGQVEMS